METRKEKRAAARKEKKQTAADIRSQATKDAVIAGKFPHLTQHIKEQAAKGKVVRLHITSNGVVANILTLEPTDNANWQVTNIVHNKEGEAVTGGIDGGYIRPFKNITEAIAILYSLALHGPGVCVELRALNMMSLFRGDMQLKSGENWECFGATAH